MSHRDNILVEFFLIDLSIYSYRYYVPNGTIILMPYLWVLSCVDFQLITAISCSFELCVLRFELEEYIFIYT
ncbi:MAG: hypothetical protein AB1414_04525 [bacterium]